jgi:hypothetical protein
VSRYVFVADEMGTPGMAPGTSNTFVFGGYVVGERDIPRAISAWHKVKTEMCGHADVELKWKHFFVDADDPKIACPLLVKNTHARRNLAALALDYLFHQTPLIPVVAVSRKDRATDFFIVQSKKGKDKLDDELMWMGPVAQFALFLNLHRAKGMLWFDRLGSEKQEARRQASWSEQLRKVRDGEIPSPYSDNLRKILAINEKIAFLDSAENEAVQIADFVCGVIWQAAEGDEVFLGQLIDKYGPSATRQGLGILHIQ